MARTISDSLGEIRLKNDGALAIRTDKHLLNHNKRSERLLEILCEKLPSLKRSVIPGDIFWVSGSPCGVMDNVPDNNIVMDEFKLQSRY